MIEFSQKSPETERDVYRPIIVGIKHKKETIPETLAFLAKYDFEGKRVMLEICDYPIPEKYHLTNLEFCEFFEAVAEKITAGGGIVLAGDSEELIDHAAGELERLWVEGVSVYLCGYRETVTRERDPHFLRYAKDNKPDMIILDTVHAEYVARGLGYTE